MFPLLCSLRQTFSEMVISPSFLFGTFLTWVLVLQTAAMPLLYKKYNDKGLNFTLEVKMSLDPSRAITFCANSLILSNVNSFKCHFLISENVNSVTQFVPSTSQGDTMIYKRKEQILAECFHYFIPIFLNSETIILC